MGGGGEENRMKLFDDFVFIEHLLSIEVIVTEL